ncbi:MAG: hypothetical protein N4A59_02180 [Marinifilum sp.]|jgi:hypothetical protein|nr:hypothetical protein [Marinifilum sp.]
MTKKPEIDRGSFCYDYEVLYNYQGKENIKEDKYRNRFSFDSLYVIVESNFKDDTLEIKQGNKVKVKDILKTEQSSGIASDYVFGAIGQINGLTMRINRGPFIYIDLFRKNNNLIGIRKDKDKVQVVFYKKVPRFD